MTKSDIIVLYILLGGTLVFFSLPFLADYLQKNGLLDLKNLSKQMKSFFKQKKGPLDIDRPSKRTMRSKRPKSVNEDESDPFSPFRKVW